MESRDLQNLVRPVYSVIRAAIEAAEVDVMAAVAILRNVRKTERASIWHAAIRENLRPICEICAPFIELTEESEGRALDALLMNIDSTRVALRWGRYDQINERINRNATLRTESADQGFLFGELFDPHGLPTATICYELDDDTPPVAGAIQWWMSRIALRRERVDSVEFIEEIASYTIPHRINDFPDPRTVDFVAAHHQRVQQLEQLAHQLRSNLA